MVLYWQEGLRAVYNQRQAADRAKWARLHRDAKPRRIEHLERAKDYQRWSAFLAKRARDVLFQSIEPIPGVPEDFC